jgi:glycosyltransferase involved in cell wall biosynthesis
MTPHVAIYVPSLCGGGAERVVLTLAQSFAARGLKVDFVLARAEGALLAEVPDTVRIVDLRASRVLASLPGLVRYLRQVRPKAMLATPDHASAVAVMARALSGVPCQLVVRIANTLSASVRGGRGLKSRIMPLCLGWLYRHAGAVVAVSNGVADDFARATGFARSSILTIYNPAVTSRVLTRAQEPLDHPWFAPGEPPVVLGVGRLAPQKDFATLIRAFAILSRRVRARLMILGEGGERESLLALIRQLRLEDSVALPGFVANPFSYMSRASLYVLSSAWEGLPGTLIEAMACGTPVVSTDCPSGPAEILEGGRWGRLVPVGDAQAMAEAMEISLQGGERPQVAHRAQHFGLEQAVAAYLHALKVEV